MLHIGKKTHRRLFRLLFDEDRGYSLFLVVGKNVVVRSDPCLRSYAQFLTSVYSSKSPRCDLEHSVQQSSQKGCVCVKAISHAGEVKSPKIETGIRSSSGNSIVRRKAKRKRECVTTGTAKNIVCAARWRGREQ